MNFRFKLWVFSITLHLFDIDLTDGDVSFGITISWAE